MSLLEQLKLRIAAKVSLWYLKRGSSCKPADMQSFSISSLPELMLCVLHLAAMRHPIDADAACIQSVRVQSANAFVLLHAQPLLETADVLQATRLRFFTQGFL